MARARTWIKRVVLGLGALIVIALGALLITIHTDFGRELIREQVEARMNDTFIGGASIGAVEGSPFGDLTLRHIVINGPDGQPAISIGTLELELGLLPLISKRARLSRLVATDVDVILARTADGELQLAHMMRPAPDSGWSVAIPEIQVHRGHVAFDTGTEQGVINLDALTIYGGAYMPKDGPLEANVSIRGTWRERAAGVGVDAVVRAHEGVTSLPSVTVLLGGVTIAGSAIRIEAGPPDAAPIVTGTVVINAPAAAVRQLVPEVQLPVDLAVAITAYTRTPWTQLSVIGQLGATPVRAMLSADLATRRVLGVVSSGDLDLGTLSGGTLAGHGGGIVMFDGALGRANERPVASGVIAAWGEVLDAPHAQVAIAFSTDGVRASTVIGARGDSVTAMLAADLEKLGEALTLERGTLIASTSNVERASGGVAPVRGALDVRLTARGALLPTPDLAVEGRIQGTRLRGAGASIASLDLAIRANGLPNQPRGKLELELVDVVRDEIRLRRLELDAANRDDGRIAVTVRTRPAKGPWLLDFDALVTPPGAGEVVAIDLLRHHLRAGSGGDWRGSTGFIEIGPERIVVRDLTSAGASGSIAIAGLLDRAGRDAGDLTAAIDVVGFELDNVAPTLRGTVEAHVDITRRDDRFAGSVAVTAKGVAMSPAALTFDADVSVTGQADKLVIAATASSPRLGKASFALDVDAPKDLANVEAWKHLRRDVIRHARLGFEDVDLAQVAELAGRKGELSGRLDGELHLDATTSGGVVRIHDVMAPALRAIGGVSAELKISQPTPDELRPVLTGTLGGIGSFEVAARLRAPDRLFDVHAWKVLGPGVVRGATARLVHIKLEPGLLDRLGWTTDLRGDVSFSAEVSEAMRSARVAVSLRDLRGTPIAEPVNAYFSVAIDDKAAVTTLAVRAPSAALLEMRGTVPITLAQLRADPRAVLALPIALTATIPNAPAPAMLHVFGRSEVIGGTIAGTIEVGGTVGAPTLRASIAGTNLEVPPGPRNRPIKKLEAITLDATWDGTTGTIAIRGKQQAGSLEVTGSANPRALDRGTLTIKAKAFDLTPLLVFVPGQAGAGAGRLDADLAVKGLDPLSARVTGELHVTRGRFPISPNVGTLRRAKVDVVISESAMKIAVDGRLGGGSLTLLGTIGLDGARPTGGDAVLTLRKISPIGTVEPDIDATVKVKLTRDAEKWIADVFVHDATVKVPRGRGEKLKPVGPPADMVFATGDRITGTRKEQGEPPRRPTLVANITIYSTYIESDELRGIIKGRLTVSVDAKSIGIVGRIDADRGDLDLFGRRYQVDRAAIRFDGSLDPLLDLQIIHDFPEVTTVTQVRGRLSKPELSMGSNPGMYSQGQLLGFLLGGEPSGDPRSGGAREAVTGAGTSIIASKIGGYMRNALPVDIDVLRYEAATASSSAAVTVGSWLSRSLFVSYRRHLEARPDENAGEGEAEYWLSRRVMVEAVVGDRGFNGIDLLWRKRY